MSDKTRLPTRFSRLFRLLCWLIGIMFKLHSLDKNDVPRRNRMLSQAAANGLRIANVRVETGEAPQPPSDSLLVVSNHVSWLDILVLSTVFPSSFIAMKEIRRWPVLGKIIANCGTVFIDRSSRKEIEPVNAAIAEALETGANVCFFPEARTSLGNGVLPLKAALFQAAINSGHAIQPVALRYYGADGRRTEAVSFAAVNLLLSLWLVVSQREITVRMDCAPPIRPQDHPDADRFMLKDRVAGYLEHKVLSDSPAPDRLLP